MDGTLSVYSEENVSIAGSQYFDESPYAANEQSEEAILKDGGLRINSRRKKVLRCGGIFILTVTFFALVGSFVAKKNDTAEGKSCQRGVVQETKTPQLEIYMTGVSQLPSETEKHELEQAIADGYNEASGVCSDEYQRWMYSTSLVHLEVHEKLVFTDQTTRLENAFLDTPTLVTRFETKISCNQCADETAFSSIYPASFGGQEHGRQLTNEALSRLDAADALTAMERAVRRVLPEFQGFLEANIITTGVDESSSVMTISKEHDGDEFLPNYFRDEAMARVRQAGDCDESSPKRKRGKASKGSGTRSSKSTKGSRGGSRKSSSGKGSSSNKGKKSSSSKGDTDEGDKVKDDTDDDDKGEDDKVKDDEDDDDKNDDDKNDDDKNDDDKDNGDKDKDDKDKDDKDKDDKDKDDKDKDDKDKDDKDKDDKCKDKDDKGNEDNEDKGDKEKDDKDNDKDGKDDKANDDKGENGKTDKMPDKRDGALSLANPACEVCGPNKRVTNPEAIFNWPGQEPVSCGDLELAGQIGRLPADSCPLLPRLIGICGCA
jgi:hypothetical protein